jgi:hypothetical protein
MCCGSKNMFVYCICIKFVVYSDATIEYEACAGILEQSMGAIGIEQE